MFNIFLFFKFDLTEPSGLSDTSSLEQTNNLDSLKTKYTLNIELRVLPYPLSTRDPQAQVATAPREGRSGNI